MRAWMRYPALLSIVGLAACGQSMSACGTAATLTYVGGVPTSGSNTLEPSTTPGFIYSPQPLPPVTAVSLYFSALGTVDAEGPPTLTASDGSTVVGSSISCDGSGEINGGPLVGADHCYSDVAGLHANTTYTITFAANATTFQTGTNKFQTCTFPLQNSGSLTTS